MKRYTTGQVIGANIKPIVFLVHCTALGFLLGSAWAGLAAGVVVIAIATLFF